MAVVVVAGRRTVLPYALLMVAAPTLVAGSFYLGASVAAVRSASARTDAQLLALLLSCLLLFTGFVLLVVGLWRLRRSE